MLRGRYHDTVDHDPGDLHLAGTQGARVGHPFDLDDDKSAGVAGGGCNGQSLQGEGLLFHGDVAIGVGGRAAQNRNVDGHGFVGQIILAVELDPFDDVAGGAGVDFAPAIQGVDEGAQAHRGDRTRFAGRNVPEHV